jgi:site-specific DNA-methyltransferase (adenine-specific)/adenine-specific DNA-methyltransferase
MANDTHEQISFEFEAKKTIKGYPELHWTGKRPFKSTVYYPAQLKEVYGGGAPYTDKDGNTAEWLNKIFWGDNLQVMSHLLKNFRGRVDLIYIDPPFDSKADYKKKIALKGQTVTNDTSAFEEKQYGDIWTNDEYLQFMYERLILLRELLSDRGSIYVHMDEKRAGYIRLILDEVFGQDNFRREIIWDITVLSGFKVSANNWIRGHDIILYYSKTNDVQFNKLRQPHLRKYFEMFNQEDENGDKYMVAHGSKRFLKDIIDKGKPFGDVWDDLTSYQIFRRKIDEIRSMDELKTLLQECISVQDISNVWDNIMSFQQQPTAAENCGYPTQKPQTLLERIIKASSNPGDLVFDCFMGSGTTQAVAMKLGRRFIGADINLGAVQTTTKRLLKVAAETQGTLLDDAPKYTGFEVYNVNNYEIFRNPLEARSILLQALEIEPFESSSVYDGEKDGRMVKIMPSDVNRIATKADLDGFIANLPYKVFERRKEENPNAEVLKLTVVCMGHEPDLGAAIKRALHNYKVDVEVVDILRDRSDLTFKRDAQAEIRIEGGKLVIKNFYPLNLMQKLSMQRENVDEWRQLVESIMIDFNYDGAVLQPSVIDAPEKNGFVAGVYDIPKDAGTIKIKITDLLSESLETEVK